MKTSPLSTTDAIWASNDDLLPDENCFPVIGSNQVSSILSTLDSSNERIENETNENEPFLDNSGGKYQVVPSSYTISKENNSTNKVSTLEKTNNLKNGENIEKILYFVCNLCPFLCIKNWKITEHLQNAHKNKTVRKIPHLKCPACANVFNHKMSLRSHLLHDHGVANSDLNIIIQAVVHSANKLKNDNSKQKKTNNQINETVTEPKVSSFEPSAVLETDCGSVNLPKVEINEVKAVQAFNSMMNQEPRNGKLKKYHNCIIPFCKVQMQSMDNLNYHLSCHKENGFSCLVCNENFTLWKSLSSHLWRLHQIDMELYSCDQCNYKSVSFAKLNNIHKLIHGDVKAYVCTTCKKAFKNSKQLNNHSQIHRSHPTKYTCDTCSKNFNDKRQLKIHISMVHEKLKPFLCNYCPYKGSSKSSLKMHIRQHTGEKPFACDTCSYTTSDHNSLRRHKLRHTGQKPYKCSYCSYACIQSSTYKVHLKTKHPGLEKDLMFTCHECQFRSVNKDMYVMHMVTVHDVKANANSN